MRWRGVYDDGSWIEEDDRPGGAYAAIDRSRLVRFEIYTDLGLLPTLTVHVPIGKLLVYRHRHDRLYRIDYAMVAVESADRSWAVVDFLDLNSGMRQRLDGYLGVEPFTAPKLTDEEAAWVSITR